MTPRFRIRDATPKIQSFVCPITQEDSLLDNGCGAFEAKFLGASRSPGRLLLGRFRCDCGKTLYVKMLNSDGVELTWDNCFGEHTKRNSPSKG